MTHPHVLLVWFCYILGLALHVLMAAADTVQDKTVTYKGYFRKYAVAIVGRFFVLLCIFPFIWDNPSTFDLEGTFHSQGAQIGAAGVIGFFCDSFAGRALSALGITQKLPALPGETK